MALRPMVVAPFSPVKVAKYEALHAGYWKKTKNTKKKLVGIDNKKTFMKMIKRPL